MDFLSLVLSLIFVNALAAGSCFAFFTALGNYGVRKPAPGWLSGTGLYCHRFLDGLEYTFTRSAMAVSMARNLLVLKYLRKQTSGPAAAASPATPPPMPPLPELLQKAMLLSSQVSSFTTCGLESREAPEAPEAPANPPAPTTATTPKAVRSRSRITPPKTSA